MVARAQARYHMHVHVPRVPSFRRDAVANNSTTSYQAWGNRYMFIRELFARVKARGDSANLGLVDLRFGYMLAMDALFRYYTRRYWHMIAHQYGTSRHQA